MNKRLILVVMAASGIASAAIAESNPSSTTFKAWGQELQVNKTPHPVYGTVWVTFNKDGTYRGWNSNGYKEGGNWYNKGKQVCFTWQNGNVLCRP